MSAMQEHAELESLRQDLAEARRHLQAVIEAYMNDRPLTLEDAMVLADIYLKGGI